MIRTGIKLANGNWNKRKGENMKKTCLNCSKKERCIKQGIDIKADLKPGENLDCYNGMDEIDKEEVLKWKPGRDMYEIKKEWLR